MRPDSRNHLLRADVSALDHKSPCAPRTTKRLDAGGPTWRAISLKTPGGV